MVSVEPNLGVNLGFGVENKRKLEVGDSIFDLDKTLTLTLKGKGRRRGGTYLGFLASVNATICTGRRPRRWGAGREPPEGAASPPRVPYRDWTQGTAARPLDGDALTLG